MDFKKFPWDKQQLLIEIRYVHNKGAAPQQLAASSLLSWRCPANQQQFHSTTGIARQSQPNFSLCCADDLNTTSVLLPSAAGVLNLRPESKGDDSSGWHVDSVELEPYAVADPARQLRVRIS